MRRREFITLIGGAVAACPLAARAQQPAMPVVAYFSARSLQTDGPMLAAFRQGLHDTGHVEGRNMAIEYRFAEGQYDRLLALAEDLVRRQVAVIVTGGGEAIAQAAKAATTKIPIVFNVGGDPVRFGLVSSLNRPGGNLTGFSSFMGALGAKQLGLLRELVPNVALIAMLVNPNDPFAEWQITETQAAARAIDQQLIVLKAASEPDIETAFETIAAKRAGALLLIASALFVTRMDKLIALAARQAVPTLYFRREFAPAGGLMTYGSSTAEGYRQMGLYAGRILKGEKPADLPVVQPIKFELIINLKTAKALSLTVPDRLLVAADEVIE